MKRILEKIKWYWGKNPLACIMLIAVVSRACAIVFAKGYGMDDDHFCVIDIAQKWLNGSKDWFGQSDNLRSFLYPGLHYLLFDLLQKIGIFDPQIKMYFVRFFNALFSLITVYFGYKTMKAVTSEKSAKLIGLLLAILWPMPFMSVRDLLEFACIPPMMIGIYFLYKNWNVHFCNSSNSSTGIIAPLSENGHKILYAIVAGLAFGLAFTLRFQTLSIAGTIGLVLLVSKRIKESIVYGIAFFFSAFCFQGIPDWVLCGSPIISFWNYLTYNSANGDAYTTGPFYTYIGLIIGVLIPPTSLLLLYGFCRTWKKHALIFWPTMAFFIIHSIYPNKQERFILPILPFIAMLSVVGWQEFVEKSAYWQNKRKLLKGLWVWFWVFNSLLLLLTTFTYSKKSRVETLSYLYHCPDVTGAIIETSDAGVPHVPLFYLHKNIPLYCMTYGKNADSLRAEIQNGATPNRVVFLSANNLAKRINRMETILPGLVFEKTISPSIADQLLYFLNPKHNVNQTSYIYKVGK